MHTMQVGTRSVWGQDPLLAGRCGWLRASHQAATLAMAPASFLLPCGTMTAVCAHQLPCPTCAHLFSHTLSTHPPTPAAHQPCPLLLPMQSTLPSVSPLRRTPLFVLTKKKCFIRLIVFSPAPRPPLLLVQHHAAQRQPAAHHQSIFEMCKINFKMCFLTSPPPTSSPRAASRCPGSARCAAPRRGTAA